MYKAAFAVLIYSNINKSVVKQGKTLSNRLLDAQLSGSTVTQEPRAKAKEEPETLRAAAHEAAADLEIAMLENHLIPEKSPLTLALGLSHTNYCIGVTFQVSSKHVGRLQISARRFLSPLVLNPRSSS